LTFFLVPGDKGIRSVSEARQAAKAIVEVSSEPTTASSERVRELSGVLCLVKAERARNLHLNGDGVCVKYNLWKMDKT
jgi:hypothetical protein